MGVSSVFSTAYNEFRGITNTASEFAARNGVQKARTIATSVAKTSFGADRSAWAATAWRAAGAGAAGGAAGYASDRDLNGTLKGAGLGVLGYGAYRAGRGMWGDAELRSSVNGAKSAFRRWDNKQAAGYYFGAGKSIAERAPFIGPRAGGMNFGFGSFGPAGKVMRGR